MRDTLTAERLRDLLSYNPATGVFAWRVSRGRVKAGERAGHCRKDGYVTIGVDGVEYLAHRLAWLYVQGEWPSLLDHRHCTPSDNRIDILREATKRQNAANTPTRRDNTSGFKGIHFRPDAGKWRALIKRDGRQCHLGYFATAEEAYGAYCAAAHETFGEFARVA